jgi:hypothetical protein
MQTAEPHPAATLQEIVPNSLMRRVAETGEPILLDIMSPRKEKNGLLPPSLASYGGYFCKAGWTENRSID